MPIDPRTGQRLPYPGETGAEPATTPLGPMMGQAPPPGMGGGMMGGMMGGRPPSTAPGPARSLLDGLAGRELPSPEFGGRASAPTAVPPGTPALVPPSPGLIFDPMSGRWLPSGAQNMPPAAPGLSFMPRRG